MALDFPSSPSLNQIISSEGLEYIWNGTAWVGYSSEISYPQANFTNVDAVNIDVTGITTSVNLDVTNGTIDYLIASQANISGTTTSLTLDVTNGTIDYFTSSQTNVLGIATALNLDVTNGSVDYLNSTQSNVSGTTTSLNLDVTNGTVDYLTATQVNVSGVVTATTFDGNVTGDVTGNLSGNVNSSGVSTFSNVVVGGATTDLVVVGDARITGILTIGTSSITLNGIDNTIKIGTGLTLTESGGANYAGVVTALAFFGDGTNIDISANPNNGVGLSTVGGVVGYAVTHINLFGTGISTSSYNLSSGIATVYINGGNVPIGDTFPSSPKNGDLFYNIDYGRTYIYYDEVALGVGLAAFWVDAAPFNNIIEANYALVAGIATYAPVAGVATVAQGLTGGPNVQVGRIRATGITTFERNSEFQQDVSIDGTLRVGTGVTINSGVVTTTTLNVTGQSTLKNINSSGLSTFTSIRFADDAGAGFSTYVTNIGQSYIIGFHVGQGYFQDKYYQFAATAPNFIINDVGIGTTNALYKLHVNGGIGATSLTVSGIVTANSFEVPGGNSSQFLKADGSLDSTTYLSSFIEQDTLDTVTGRENITSNGITVGFVTARNSSGEAHFVADSQTGSNAFLDFKQDGVIVSNVAYSPTVSDALELNSITSKNVVIANGGGSVGVGTTNPISKFDVRGDVSVGIDTSQGVILTSANGTRYRLIVGDDGSLSTTAV